MSNVTWRILSDYHAFGLRDAVKFEAARLRKGLHIRADVARRMALVMVRTSLVSALLAMYEHGDKRVAELELRRMARAADLWNASAKP